MFYINGAVQCAAHCDWLLSLSITFSRCVRVVRASVLRSFHGWTIFHCVGTPHAVYSSAEQMGSRCWEPSRGRLCVDTSFQFPEVLPEERDRWVTRRRRCTLRGTARLFSKAAAPCPAPPPDALVWFMVVEMGLQMLTICLSFTPFGSKSQSNNRLE